jgi:hypothetical protein
MTRQQSTITLARPSRTLHPAVPHPLPVFCTQHNGTAAGHPVLESTKMGAQQVQWSQIGKYVLNLSLVCLFRDGPFDTSGTAVDWCLSQTDCEGSLVAAARALVRLSPDTDVLSQMSSILFYLTVSAAGVAFPPPKPRFCGLRLFVFNRGLIGFRASGRIAREQRRADRVPRDHRTLGLRGARSAITQGKAGSRSVYVTQSPRRFPKPPDVGHPPFNRSLGVSTKGGCVSGAPFDETCRPAQLGPIKED